MTDKEKAIADKLLTEIEDTDIDLASKGLAIQQYHLFLQAVAQRQAIEREPR